MTPLLSLRNLRVDYRHHREWVPALNNVSFTLGRGETMGLLGESGCGKSTLALALMGLLPPGESRLEADEMVFDDQNLLTLSSEQWRSLRGRRIAMIFQDPFSSLNPVFTIERQLRETVELNGSHAAKKELSERLAAVHLTDTDRLLSSYPHQLSGGQRQRVMIAIALARHPDLVLADEPTTALDVTVQAEILSLLKDLCDKEKRAMIFVTHNMALLKTLTQRVAVLKQGAVVEVGPTMDVLYRPQHPYTQRLVAAVPRRPSFL